MSTTTRQHTLFLWPHVNFPRRLIYYLILKGLVASPKDIPAGKTNDPNLKINIVTLNVENDSWKTSDPNDPFPEGKRHPLLRVTETSTGKVHYIHESRSILGYLEAIYPDSKINGSDPLLQALNADLMSIIDEAIAHLVNYAKHSSKTAHAFFGFPESARSKDCALDSKSNMNKTLFRLQTWSQGNGSLTAEHPWLAVKGTSEVGPGLPDMCLIAWWRYCETSYGMDVLEDENLGPLRKMREAFMKQTWWEEVEGENGFATPPDELRRTKDDFEF